MSRTGKTLGSGLRYSFARNLTRLRAEQTLTVGAMTGSGTIAFSDSVTVQDANAKSFVKYRTLSAGRAAVYTFARNLQPLGPAASVGEFSASLDITFGSSTSLAAALTGSTSITVSDTTTLYSPFMRGTSLWRATQDVADLAPSPGYLEGSGAVVSSDVAALTDVNTGTTSITGSASFVSASNAEAGVLTIQGSGAITLADVADITPSRGRLRGTSSSLISASASVYDAGAEPQHWVGINLKGPFRVWGTPSAVHLSQRISPLTSLGEITGSTTITFSDVTVVDGRAFTLTASTDITFADSTQLDNVGGPGTVALEGSASITFGDSASLVDIALLSGNTIIRLLPSSAIRGGSRLVTAEEIQFDSSTFLRANAHIDTTGQITFGSSAALDNIGVELATGSMSIAVTDHAVISGKYVSWFPETGSPGAWTKESEASDGWNKESSVSDDWIKEAS